MAMPSQSNQPTPPMDANQERHPRDGGSKLPGFWRSRAAIGLIIFFVIGTFLLTSEHRAHVFGMLPYLLLLACPLLHVFMHGGHGRHGRHGPGDSKPGSEDRS